MDMKIFLFLIGAITFTHGASLLRTPKVYNAVITTDENLTPSRAYPVIQPTIHETGIATYPIGPFNPYRFYTPPLVHFGPPGFPHGLIAREPLPVPHAPSQDIEREQNPPEQRMLPPPPEMEIQSQSSQSQPESDNQQSQPNNLPENNNQMQEERVPIPLNEFGLPPSLVPLQTHPHQTFQNPINLQPYSYNHYPLIYEPSIRQFSDPYLPHYGFYPPHTYSIHQLAQKLNTPPQQISAPTKPRPSNDKTQSPSSDKNTESPSKQNDLESIKNGSSSKNSDVPDVPPPPIPSGAKPSN